MKWVPIELGCDPVSPKFAWVMAALREVGIVHRLNGDAIERPVVEVHAGSATTTRKLVDPVLSLADDDDLFRSREEAARYPWWCFLDPDLEPTVGAMAGGIGLVAHKTAGAVRTATRCVPHGADPLDCPLRTGAIEACPQNLWKLCEPMVRLTEHLVPMAGVLRAADEESIRRAGELIEVFKARRGDGLPGEFDRAVCFCFLVAGRLTTGRLEGLLESSPEVVVDLVMKERPPGPLGLSMRSMFVGGFGSHDPSENKTKIDAAPFLARFERNN